MRYYYLIPPPFEMKFWVVLAAWNAIRPEEALFSPVTIIGVISNDYLLVICGTNRFPYSDYLLVICGTEAKELLPATTLQAAFGTFL